MPLLLPLLPLGGAGAMAAALICLCGLAAASILGTGWGVKIFLPGLALVFLTGLKSSLCSRAYFFSSAADIPEERVWDLSCRDTVITITSSLEGVLKSCF